ncbi:MAG TPA: type II CAAX endopeptidase family protein [Anaerolineae bacterium]|nr:MAG: CAAX amino terminal protease self- immunity [Chloroflexi bacterium ADurb.Bin222]HOC21354.1 type II CAAX endopeptidase family protein [Anaerolineae bacterium]HQM14257.1 type II CAAX endopeptidase family protein [Anaerolineae bacterium]
MKNLFWNASERRVRTLWRLVGQIALLLILTTCLGMALILPAIIGNGLEEELRIEGPLLWLANLAMFPAVLLSVWLAGRFLDRRPFADFGFHFGRAWWADFAAGLALGALLMAVIFLVERAAGWITVTDTLRTTAFGGAFALALCFDALLYLAVGIYEELLFRGYFLRNLAEGLRLPRVSSGGALALSWALTSVGFGLAHASNPNASVVSTLTLIVAGLFLGWGYLLTGSLALPIGIHITWNFFQGTVFGFPVSGKAADTAFFVIKQGGPTLWTGGAFGPEAGLIGLLAMFVGSLAIVGWVRWRYGRVTLRSELAEYIPRLPSADSVVG